MDSQRRCPCQGEVGADRFHLTPVVWGQKSFLPQIIGIFRASDSGTDVEINVVPNLAVQVSLVILFGFFGILVFDHELPRVMAITCSTVALAWLWLMVGHVVGTTTVKEYLRQLLDACDLPAPVRKRCRQVRRNAASWLIMLAWNVVGIVVELLIYNGQLMITTRPAVDLAFVYWITQAVTIVWLLWLSGISPNTQFRLLLILFTVELVRCQTLILG